MRGFMSSEKNQVWETNYQSGRFNSYPFDDVVSFIMSRFGRSQDRRQIRILDLGSGGGNNARFLCAEGFDVYAVDGSPKSVELTNKFMRQEGAKENAVVANFKELPYEDDYFNCVVDRQSIGHNPGKEIDAIIAEVFRTLKTGGYYLGFVLSNNHPHIQFGKPMNLEGDVNHFTQGSFIYSGLVHFFSVSEIERRFCKFEIEDIILRSSKSLRSAVDSSYNDQYFIVIGKKS